MKQTILRYGLISGAVAAVLMTLTAMKLSSSMDFENGHYYGYAGILLSMIFVFLGVRSYREQVNGGVLSFAKGFQVGLLIAIVSCICYVLAWMVVSETLIPDFMDKYIEHALSQLKQSGAAQTEIERQTTEMQQFKEMYKHPLVKFGMTFLEPFPVGLLVALISAAVLQKTAA
ncbi:MAG: DUF4199 domain-containing protein [Saprospiraceae bacterium]|nr:DUF4199 domain-containing protein [Saprospiraceae bacterium]